MPLYQMTNEESCIIIFAKAPIHGHVKTRLAKDMDASVVLSLYRNFVKDIIDKISDMGHHIKIFYDPPGSESLSLMREWLGDYHEFVLQTGSDLGQKMANAFEYVFKHGTRQAVLLGTDFPDLPKEIISDAIQILKIKDAVIGPAIDGGYYLIGFSSDTYLQTIFTDIAWGTSAVFQQTMDVFLSSGFEVHQLPKWRDVDVYDDLKDLIQSLRNHPDKAIHTYSFLEDIGMMTIDVSIIIPVINEERIINQALERLLSAKTSGAFEIIVVDGNVSGNTLRAITEKDIIKIKSPCGRGAQMNAGARAANGWILLFLHADTILPKNAIDSVISACRLKQIIGGAFDLGIDSDRPGYRLIEKITSLRSRRTRIPYGDQAIFLKKKAFVDIGAYNEIPIMEDIDLMLRVKQNGHKIKIISKPVKTSARRWENEGIVYCTLRNYILSKMFYLGVSPVILKKYYK